MNVYIREMNWLGEKFEEFWNSYPESYVMGWTIVLSAVHFYYMMRLNRAFARKYLGFYKGLYAANKRDYDQRITSIIHSIVVCLLVLYQWCCTPLFTFSDKQPSISRSHALARFTMGYAAGYFIFDTVTIINEYPVLGDLGMISHHIVSLWTVYYTISRPYGHMYMMWVLFSECTTPFINMKFLLEYMGLKEHPIFGINGLVIFLGWILGRLVLFTYYFLHVVQRWHETKVLTVSGLVVLTVLPGFVSILNVFWFWKILQGVLKHFFKVGGKKGKGAVAVGKKKQ